MYGGRNDEEGSFSDVDCYDTSETERGRGREGERGGGREKGREGEREGGGEGEREGGSTPCADIYPVPA